MLKYMVFIKKLSFAPFSKGRRTKAKRHFDVNLQKVAVIRNNLYKDYIILTFNVYPCFNPCMTPSRRGVGYALCLVREKKMCCK